MMTVLFVACGLSIGGSLWLWNRGQAGWALALLMAGAFCLRLGIAQLDPFLHDYDERFHALVARNMVADPFRPMLRVATPLPYDYKVWYDNHVWLHKQPLFLWQMALSMKLFGINELALRLPSALLTSLLLWPVYRIGSLAADARTGYLAALLLTFAYYQLEEVSGALGMDHNDVAFTAYVAASVWAYYEYRAGSPRLRWALAAGAFAGAAVLCKWLTGLVVFGVWGLDIVLSANWRQQRAEYGRLLVAALVAALVVLPWQLYTAWRFPAESAYERHYNTRHFTEVLEGHENPWYYHFQQAGNQYGWLVLLLVAGLLMAVLQHRKYPRMRPLLVIITVVYLFFTLAATKVWSYAYAVSPLVLVVVSLPLSVGWARLVAGGLGLRPAAARSLGTFGIMAVLVLDLQPWGIVQYHFNEQAYGPHTGPLNRKPRVANAALYRTLAAQIPANYVVLNALPNEEVQAMFYCGRAVYSWWPPQPKWNELRRRVPGLAVFPSHHNQDLPDFISQTPEVIIIWGTPE